MKITSNTIIDNNYIMDHIASCDKCISMPVDKALQALHPLAFETLTSQGWVCKGYISCTLFCKMVDVIRGLQASFLLMEGLLIFLGSPSLVQLHLQHSERKMKKIKQEQ